MFKFITATLKTGGQITVNLERVVAIYEKDGFVEIDTTDSVHWVADNYNSLMEKICDVNVECARYEH